MGIYQLNKGLEQAVKSNIGKVSDGVDNDAQIYITAAGITDQTEIDAVNQFVKDLKGTGLTPNSSDIWQDRVGLYIFSPTSLAAALVNLATPGTNDLTAVNAPTHATTGVTTNGTTQYFQTGIIPSADLADHDFTISAYFRDGVSFKGYIGTENSGSQRIRSYMHNIQFDAYNSTTGRLTATNSGGGSSLITCVRRSPIDQEAYRKAVSLGTNTTNVFLFPPTLEFYIAAFNDRGSALAQMANECRGAAILTHGLTDAENDDWDDAWNRYQTNVIAGGRQLS